MPPLTGAIEKVYRERKALFLTVFLVLVCAISFTGLNGSLQNMDECLYANISRETLEQKSLIPLKEGQYYLHKSPMTFWTAALSFKLFGVNDFAAKFPSALASVITGLVIFLMVMRLFQSPLAGLLSTVIYLTSLQVYASSHQLATDSLMSMFLTCALFNTLEGIGGKKGRFFAAAALNGLAILTKSVMGFVVPAALLLYVLFHRKWHLFPYFFLIFFVSLIIASPYYLMVYHRDKALFVEQFIRADILSRFLSGEGFSLTSVTRICSAALQYAAFLIIFTLPFSTGVFYLFFGKREKGNLKNPIGDTLWGPKTSLLSLHFLLIYVGFSVSSANGVWPHYTIPMLPAVCVYLGAAHRGTRSRSGYLAAAFFSLVSLAVFLTIFISQAGEYPTYTDVVWGLALVTLLYAALNFVFYGFRIDFKNGIVSVAAAYLLAFTLMTALIVPMDFNADIKGFRKFVYGKPDPLFLINTKKVNEGRRKGRATLWYMRMPATEFRTLDEYIKNPPGVDKTTYLIFYKSHEDYLKRMYGSLSVIHRGRLWTLSVIE